MAGPVAHIFCALSVLNSGTLNITDTKEFIIGTSFPNIRYLGDIKKNLQKRKITWDSVQDESSPFKAGMLLHMLLDEARERYFVERNLYEILPKKKNLAGALKLYEDMIIYDWIDDWRPIIRYFDTILPEEQQFKFDQDCITLCHTFLQQYLIVHPTREYVSALVIKLHPTFSTMTSFLKPLFISIFNYYVNTLMNLLEQTPEVKEIITSFYKNCVEHITQ